MDLEIVKLAAGLATAAIGGVWAVFVYFDKRRAGEQEAKGGNSVASGAPSRPAVAVPGGAVLVVLAGLSLCAWALAGAQRPDRSVTMTTDCGVAGGRDVQLGDDTNISC
jgi:hypothetical protein